MIHRSEQRIPPVFHGGDEFHLSGTIVLRQAAYVFLPVIAPDVCLSYNHFIAETRLTHERVYGGRVSVRMQNKVIGLHFISKMLWKIREES